MRCKEIEITSVLDYIKEVNALLKDSGFRSKVHTAFFRGHADKQWELVPGLLRNEGLINNEDLMYRSVVAKHTSEFNMCTSALDYLVKMQHYGLPTRLLDLTTNPLVALYFACEEHQAYDKVKGKSGEVIVLKVPTLSIKHYDSDTISILSNVAKCKEEEMRICLYSDNWSDGNFYDELDLKDSSRKKCIHHIGEYYTKVIKELLNNEDMRERLKVIMTSLLDLAKSNNLKEPSFYDQEGNLKGNDEIDKEIGAMELKTYEKGMLRKLHTTFMKEPIYSKNSMSYITWFNNLGQIQFLLHQISQEKSHFSAVINPHDLARVYIVNAKQDNQRIRNQMGAFVLFGLGMSDDDGCLMLSKKEKACIPNDWNLSSSTRLIIPPECKRKIIDDLGLLGIKKSFIYPELDVFTKELEKQYKK